MRSAVPLFLIAVSLPAAAQEPAPAALPEHMIRDGRVTMAELQAHSGEAFRGLDANGDGVISADEFASFRLPAGQTLDDEARHDLFDHIDKDDDGTLHGGEWQVATDKAARLSDLDGDGYVSLVELADMHRNDTLDEAVPAGMFLEGLADRLF